MLTTENLEECFNFLMEKVLAASKRPGYRPELDKNALLSSTIFNEIHRRKHGPYSLSEAIASGRPFRRKAWGDDPGFCRLAKDCSSSWFDFGWQTDCIDRDDITATDYELQEEQP